MLKSQYKLTLSCDWNDIYWNWSWIWFLCFHWKSEWVHWNGWIIQIPWFDATFRQRIHSISFIERASDKVRRIIPESIRKVFIYCRPCIAVWRHILWSRAIPRTIDKSHTGGSTARAIGGALFFPCSIQTRWIWEMRNAKLLNYTSWSDTDSNNTLKCSSISIWIGRIFRTFHERRWEEKEIFLFVPHKCTRIGEDITRWSCISERECWFLFWRFDIRDIIEVDFESSILCATICILIGVIPDTNKAILIIRMEIEWVSWDFELSENTWWRWSCEVNDKEWVNLLKRHEIKTVSDKSWRLEVFSSRKTGESTNQPSWRIYHRYTCWVGIDTTCPSVFRSHKTEVSVFIFIHRILRKWIPENFGSIFVEWFPRF